MEQNIALGLCAIAENIVLLMPESRQATIFRHFNPRQSLQTAFEFTYLIEILVVK
jgi:hypothetical protein